MAKSNIKIFISHAHKDKHIVAFFVENVLKKVLLKNYQAEIRCTSLDDSTILVGGNNLALFQDVHNTTLFIPFISANYHKSEFCLLEAGAAHMKTINKSIYVFPILDEFIKHNETIYTLIANQHALINDSNSLKQLYTICQQNGFTRLPLLSDYEKELDAFVKQYNKELRKSSKTFSAKMNLLAITENSFNSESNLDFPVTLFVNKAEYEDFSVDVIRKKGQRLLWTLYGSPLLVDPKDLVGTTFLTDYDMEFEKSVFNDKYRLVIFPDKRYAKAYKDDDLLFYKSLSIKNRFFTKKNIKCRRLKFEEANKGNELFFTTKKNIEDWAKKSKITIDFSTFDFEFAFISKGSKNSKENFGITSGFHSNSFDKDSDRNDLKHIIIYPNQIDNRLSNKFFKNNYKELLLFKDIELQIKIFEQLADKNSLLRRNYIVANKLDNSNIKYLK